VTLAMQLPGLEPGGRRPAPPSPPRVRVLPDPHAMPEYAWRAYATGGHDLGLIDAAGATPAEAEERVRERYHWVRLGLDEPAIVRIPRQRAAGQITCGIYRQALWRDLGADIADRICCWIMLNPSTADATDDDATIRRCAGYGRAWGYRWLTVANLWPVRMTDPAGLAAWIEADARPYLMASTDGWIRGLAVAADRVVCAWGNGGRLADRGRAVRELLADAGVRPHALAVSKAGEPVHPLRQRADLESTPLG